MATRKVTDVDNQQFEAIGAINSGTVPSLSIIPVTANGQISFTIPGLPTVPVNTFMFVNSCLQTYGTDYAVSGSTLSWISGDFILETTDTVVLLWFN